MRQEITQVFTDHRDTYEDVYGPITGNRSWKLVGCSCGWRGEDTGGHRMEKLQEALQQLCEPLLTYLEQPVFYPAVLVSQYTQGFRDGEAEERRVVAQKLWEILSPTVDRETP